MHSSVTVNSVKCHKCRHILLLDINNTHNKTPCNQSCDSFNNRKFIYVAEDNLPDWIKVKVEEEQWTKGKLHCENCGCKVGIFDFVSGRKCQCGEIILPPVHFVSSQVDIPVSIPNLKK